MVKNNLGKEICSYSSPWFKTYLSSMSIRRYDSDSLVLVPSCVKNNLIAVGYRSSFWKKQVNLELSQGQIKNNIKTK